MFLLFISQTHNDSDSSTFPIESESLRDLPAARRRSSLSWVCDGKVRAGTSRWVYGVGRWSGSAAWFDGEGQGRGPVTLSVGWTGGSEAER